MTWRRLTLLERFAVGYGGVVIVMFVVFLLMRDVEWYSYLSVGSSALIVASFLWTARERIRREDRDKRASDGQARGPAS